jgi:hypothetical protein
MYAIKPIKRTSVMSNFLRMATAIAMLAFAATGAAQARGNFDRDSHSFAQAQTQDTYPGYAASRELWPWYVPSHGIVGESCGDAFQPICK